MSFDFIKILLRLVELGQWQLYVALKKSSFWMKIFSEFQHRIFKVFYSPQFN